MMKVTLAIVVAIAVFAGLGVARSKQNPQQQTPPAETPQGGAATTPPLQSTPPPNSAPCALSKDTCELSEPAAAAPTPVQKPQTQPANRTTSKTNSHKNKRARRHGATKNSVARSDPSGPRKTIVRQGGTSDPNVVLAPGITARPTYSQQMTADLLSATDANLKEAASRPLNENQEETVRQIKVFMEQANAAMQAGDMDRGHNLAVKARLLSDDLVKH